MKDGCDGHQNTGPSMEQIPGCFTEEYHLAGRSTLCKVHKINTGNCTDQKTYPNDRVQHDVIVQTLSEPFPFPKDNLPGSFNCPCDPSPMDQDVYNGSHDHCHTRPGMDDIPRLATEDHDTSII